MTQSDSSCSSFKEHHLEIYNDVTKLWVEYNSDANKATKWPYVQNYIAATAVFDILFSTDLGTTYDGKSVTMRIRTTDPWSGKTSGTVYD